VVSDQSPPPTQQNYLYNRDTLQSTDEEGLHMNENKDGTLNPPMDPIEEESHDFKYHDANQLNNSARKSQNINPSVH
jgi:hypothetical protein